VGTAHGAEELGLCSHGLACQAGAWGHYHRALPRIWPYLEKSNIEKAGKTILQDL
jgi:hypothetical protein